MPQKFGKTLASWTVPEYEDHKRSFIWHITAAIIGVILLIVSIWTFNYLFSLIILIAGFIFYIQHYSTPNKVKFLITSKGIKIGKKQHQFKNIRNFWIIYDPPHINKLFFGFKSFTSTRLSVPLKNQNPLKIRDVLLKFLEEDLDKEEEPISEQMGRWIKM